MKLASIARLRKTAAAIAAAALMATLQSAAAQMNINTPERIEFTIDVAEDIRPR